MSTIISGPSRTAARRGRRGAVEDSALAACGSRFGRASSGKAFVLLVALGVASGGTGGCASGPGERGAVGAAGAAPLAEGENAARAFLPLSEIQPRVERPAPVEVKPLSSRGEEQIQRAEALASEQRFTEAVIELERGLRYDPGHPRILTALAELHFRAGSVERARSSAQSALAAHPDDPRLHLLLGRIAADGGQWEDALIPLRTGVLLAESAADATFAAGLYDLGVALSHAGYLSASLAQFDRLEQWLKASPKEAEVAGRGATTDASLPVLRANVLERLGRCSDAADQIARRIDGGDTAPALRVRRVRLLLAARRWEDAEKALHAVGADEPALVDLLVELREKQGRGAAVLDDLRARLAAQPDSERLALALRDAARRLNRPGDCIDDLRGFLARSPGSLEVRLSLLRLLIESSQWPVVLRVAEGGLTQDAAAAASIVEVLRGAAADPRAADAMLSARAQGAGPNLRYLRAEIAFAAGRTDRTIEELTGGGAELAARPEARRLLGEAYLRGYQWERARGAVARQQPDAAEDVHCEWILGQACEGLDDLSGAELHYKAGLQRDRTNERVMSALARVYQRTGRDLQFEQQLRAVIDAHPEKAEAREDLIVRYLETDRIEEAARQLQELDKVAPTSSALARCLVEVQRRQKADPAAAIPILEEALKRNGPDARTLVALGDLLAASQRFDDARARYEEALRLEPASEDYFLRLVGLDEALLDFESAAKRLEPMLPRYPNRHPLRGELLQALMVVQRFDDALALVQKEESRPDLSDSVRAAYRGKIIEILRLMRRPDEMYQKLSGWAAADAPAGPWSQRLILAYVEDDRVADALPLARKAFEAAGDKVAREILVNALIAADQTDRAMQLVLDSVAEDPSNEGVFDELATKLALAERYDEAIDLLKQELAVCADPDRLRERIFRFQRAAGRHDENVRFLEDWITALTRAVREQVERRGIRPDRAEEGLGRIIQMLHVWIVQELMLAKQYDAALLRLQQLLDAASDDESRFELTLLSYSIYQLAGRMAEAQQALETCHRIDPFNVGVNNDLGYLLADQGLRLDEAERMTRLALARSPRNAAYLDSYGWAKYKKGEFEEAYTWIRRSIHAEAREDEVIPDHLGDAAWQTGRRDEALARWTEAKAHAERKLTDDPKDRGAERVAAETGKKIEAARKGEQPAVAPSAAPSAAAAPAKP
ncbi:MAG: tetratricopeptide repeat protein [Phycisphaerales bacterium]|nr:tetratricopeptide repeat protein [Phycisphaerales bacterium]